MTDRNDEALPPLGERTPAPSRRSDPVTPWYRRVAVVGLAGLLTGVLVGFGLAAAIDDDPERAAVDPEPVETTVAERRTTTTVPTLPRECADAIRTAEQSLALLDQTFQTARRFNVGELDRMMSELQEVRRSLTDRVRACVERA
ncbi:MAG TPA: hypothetical protein VM388_09735 [Acidimicrobiales bacterium]|nr:hypothetical protein [Acidimicrobiales bacterium]